MPAVRARVVRLGLALASVTLAACDDGAGPGAAEAPGCYAVSLGSWSGPHEAYDPPSTIRLSERLGTEGVVNGRTLVEAPVAGEPLPYPWAWWSQPRPDSIDMIITSGFVGLRARLEAASETRWRGTLDAITDVAPEVEAQASIELTRTSCP